MALVIYTLGFIRLPLVCWLLFFCIIFFNFVFPQFFILRGYLCFFRVSEPRELQQVDPVYNMKRDFKKKISISKKNPQKYKKC